MSGGPPLPSLTGGSMESEVVSKPGPTDRTPWGVPCLFSHEKGEETTWKLKLSPHPVCPFAPQFLNLGYGQASNLGKKNDRIAGSGRNCWFCLFIASFSLFRRFPRTACSVFPWVLPQQKHRPTLFGSIVGAVNMYMYICYGDKTS